MSTFNLSSVAGRNVLITGASHGLGRSCAIELAQLNARLVLIARSIGELESLRSSFPNPQQHCCIGADLLNPVDMDRAIDQTRAFFEHIDVVIHFIGGGLGLHDTLVKGSDLMRVFALNVAIPAEINSRLLPQMLKDKRGTIIHIGSVASNEAHGSIAYNSVKAALAAYVRSIGRLLAANNIVVTGILPGGYLASGNSMERLRERNPEEYNKYIAEKLPRGRLGDAREVVGLLLFLCSDMASMMGGCMIPIDAGEGRSFLTESA